MAYWCTNWCTPCLMVTNPPQRPSNTYPGPLCGIRGALGRTRTCDLLIRSHSPSGTGRDSGGQGETICRFYRVLALLEGQGGTGRDTQLRSDCGQCSRHPGFRTIGDSGGCEKRASEPGDEAFEVGASPFIAGFNDIRAVSLTLWHAALDSVHQRRA